MISIALSRLSFKRNKIVNNRFYLSLTAVILLSYLIVSDVNAGSSSDKNYLRIEKSQSSDKTDMSIKSFGGLVFKENTMGHIELTRLDLGVHGKSLALEFGGGYVIDGDISLFIGIGGSLIYNKTEDDYIVAYFPEVGITVDLTKKVGITARSKRYHNLYDENESIIMIGMVFRD